MIKRVSNPPNPYESEQREWLEEPPPVKVEVYEEHARTILSENDSPDIPFRWSVNPYRGCQHAYVHLCTRPLVQPRQQFGIPADKVSFGHDDRWIVEA